MDDKTCKLIGRRERELKEDWKGSSLTSLTSSEHLCITRCIPMHEALESGWTQKERFNHLKLRGGAFI